jgi:hypothetical protein
MSPAGPLPEPPRRRTWLWIVLGVIGACVLLCCGFLVWSGTAGVGFWCDEFLPALIEQAQSSGDRQTETQLRQLYQQNCAGAR